MSFMNGMITNMLIATGNRRLDLTPLFNHATIKIRITVPGNRGPKGPRKVRAPQGRVLDNVQEG
jgi:hypothetical protein